MTAGAITEAEIKQMRCYLQRIENESPLLISAIIVFIGGSKML